MFYLAAHLGCTVDELSRRLSYRELIEWNAYFTLEPFGPARDNLHAGILAAVILNLFKGKTDKAADPLDFLLQLPEPKEPQSTPAMMEQAKLVHNFLTKAI